MKKTSYPLTDLCDMFVMDFLGAMDSDLLCEVMIYDYSFSCCDIGHVYLEMKEL